MLEAFIIDKLNRENEARDSLPPQGFQLPVQIEKDETAKGPRPNEQDQGRTLIEIDI